MNRAASARRAGSSAHARSSTRADGYLAIGEVLGLLRPDFPDVTISKIRFLESEGLVEPDRAPSGYRKFTDSDVERLRFVLTAQRDHYLPLRVIREHLESMTDGEISSAASVHRLARPTEVPLDGDGAPSAEVFASGRQALMTRADLLDMAGIEEALLDALESYGLVSPREGQYDGDAAAIARIAGQLSTHGLEPRHLRMFRTAADREVGVVEQLVGPTHRHRGADEQSEAEESARWLATVFLRLHTLLVKTRLRTRS